MVESVSYLHIRPLYRYRGDGNGQTTISGFDSLLEEEVSQSQSSASGGVSADQAASSSDSKTSTTAAESTDTTETTDAESASAVSLFRDPVTGKAVEYVDVSEADQITEASASTKTTSASSMKTTKYDAYFKEAAQKYGVSESLLKGIAKAESNFNPNDVSSAGAIGVMQLMPATAKELGVTNAYDPRQNILGGAKCIKQKLKEFNGDVRLALAAYNAGSGAVKRNGGVPSYCTTYVNKVLSYKAAYETAEAVG